MAKWLELLKVGKWTDRFGTAREITQDIINTVVKNFDPQKTPVHFTVGHPDKPKVPSFGVVDALKVVGDTLLFKPGSVVPEFAALVARGGFPSVSAGLDGSMTGLNHIAFLSAQAPAIEGLRPICEFSAPAENTAVVQIDVTSLVKMPEFSGADSWFRWRINGIGRLLRNLKNNTIEKQGQETADKLLDEYELNQLVGEPPDNSLSPQFSSGGSMNFEKLYTDLKALYDVLLGKVPALEGKLAEFSAVAANPAEVTALKTENGTLKTERASLLTKITGLETDKRHAEFSSYVEQLVVAGKVLPDQKAAEIAMLETLHAATPADFSAADGKKSPVDTYKDNLTARPKIAPATGASEQHGAEFSAPRDAVTIGNNARAYQDEQKAKGISIDTIAAVRHVMGGNQ